MNNYNRNDRSGNRDFNRRGSGPRQMFKAVCDECGKDCEVPFKPSGDKPIYCSECFKSKSGRGFNRSGGNGEQMSQIMEKLEEISQKLDELAKPKEVKKPKAD